MAYGRVASLRAGRRVVTVLYAGRTLGDVTFNALVVSLATTAAVHFGDVADRATGRPGPPNLEAAGRTIALLALLREKTAGNLTAGETAFLAQVLADLRERFLRAQRAGDARSGPPAADAS